VKLTVTVITKNESAHIAAALESVAWADETIVVDSGSTDDTVAIARSRATRVEVRDWAGYGAQKDYAAGLASNDWILSLDADERVTPELAREIRTLLERR
jgi:glycosyltransferase involved in cell wall biosynthesis